MIQTPLLIVSSPLGFLTSLYNEGMTLEEKLAGWRGPSSQTEQEKQERAERMVRQAVSAHPAFDGYTMKVYAKGSYANNTNVRSDSDVDIAVRCTDVCYWGEHAKGAHPPST